MKLLHQVAILLVLGVLLLAFQGKAASQQEDKAFNEASELFRLGGQAGYARADNDFTAFLEHFPNSEYRAQAALLQAQARYHLGNFSGAITVLTNSLSSAGALAGRYQYWLGECQLGFGDTVAAYRTFSQLAAQTNAPDLRLPACLGQAQAKLLQGDFQSVVETLGAEHSPLQESLRIKPDAKSVVEGQLLLAQALWKLRRFNELNRALAPLAKVSDLSPEENWQRLWLTASAQREQGQFTNALATVSNLVSVAKTTNRSDYQSTSTALLGGVLRELDQSEAAINVFRGNLATNELPAARRSALLNIIDLQLEAGRLAQATNELQAYSGHYPKDTAIASLVVGEFLLRDYATKLTAANVSPSDLTQTLTQAHAALEQASGVLTNQDLQGQTQLWLGWCLWEEGKFQESAKAFQSAADQLPFSKDQIIARFKVADAKVRQGDAADAATAYQRLVSDIRRAGPAAQPLLEPALYQWLHACIQANDQNGANTAFGQLWSDYPTSYNTENGWMLMIQSVARSDPAQARKWYNQFSEQFTNSAVLPETQLLVAQSYKQEAKWAEAFKEYDEWVQRFPDDTNRPFAEYNRGICAWNAGDFTNAFNTFTNFVAQYPTNTLTPLALDWIAGQYFDEGRYDLAERDYQRIFRSTNWPASTQTFEAGLLAGRAAFARQDWRGAQDHLTRVINKLNVTSNAPPDLIARAYIMLGDTILEQYLDDPNHSEELWGQARLAFQTVADNFATNRLGAVAWGRIGAAWMQRTSQDSMTNLVSAVNAWKQLLNLKVGDRRVATVALRGLAENVIGLALEKQAALSTGKDRETLLDQAQQRYQNVVLRKDLTDGETPDPQTFSQAALLGARLADSRGDFEYAVHLLEEAIRQCPASRGQIEPVLERVREHAQQAASARLRAGKLSPPQNE